MHRRIRPLGAALAVAALALGFAAGPPVFAAPGDAQVLMVDNEPDLTNWHYEPAEVTVPAGSTVLWHNKGKEEHSVTADNKSFDSGWRPRGANFQRTFTRPGKYTYHCAPHPWMKGVVVVVPAPTTTTTAAPATTTTVAPATTTTAATAAPAPGPGAPGPDRPAAAEPGTGAGGTTDAGPAVPVPSVAQAGEVTAAGPAGSGTPGRARRGLAGTVAIVVGPTLAGLALGAKLRRRP